MARNDKQMSEQEKYINKMKAYQEAYKIRTDFVSKFKLDPKKTKGAYPGTVVSGDTKNGTGSAADASKVQGGAPPPGGGTELGKKVAAAAEAFIGKCVYRWGGKDPTTGGADCSGFTHYVLKTTGGVEIGGDTIAQSKAGKLLEPKEKALPGDVIMFQGTYRAGPSHVGIVYEWPKFIHCGGAEGRDGVQWGSMEGDEYKASYWKTKFLSIRRVLPEGGAEAPKEEAKPKSKALALASEEPTAPMFSEKSDDEGAEWMLLNGGSRTSTPGAPQGYFSWPLHWNDVSFNFKPIQTDISAGHIRIPNEDRAMFLYKRINWGRKTGFKEMEKLNPEYFIHIDRHDGFEGNLYMPDAKLAFEIFRLKSKREKLEILSGFRFSPEGMISPHEAGCAIDIRVYGHEDARKLADIAWACGFRAIAVGGDLEKGNGFLHLDIGPKSEWGYDDIPVYNGPGRWM